MTGKLQATVLTGLLAGGMAFVQGALPRLANSASLLYLRAEYELATGDTTSAMQLMQRAATAQQRQETPKPVEKTRSETTPVCSRRAATKPIATSPKPVGPSFRVVSVRVPAIGGHAPRHVVVRVPDMRTVLQVKLSAEARARAAEHNEQMKKTMETLQATLRNLPVPPVPPLPPSVPTVLGLE